jgi:hypothetical protein
MDRDLARYVVVEALRSSSDLTNLLPLLKNHCSKSEYDELKLAISTAAAEVHQLVVRKVFSCYPDIEKEIERNIEKYGKFM